MKGFADLLAARGRVIVQYFRDLRELTAAGQPPSAELITDLMGRYATEPATAAGG